LAGLVPAIHEFFVCAETVVDARAKPTQGEAEERFLGVFGVLAVQFSLCAAFDTRPAAAPQAEDSRTPILMLRSTRSVRLEARTTFTASLE
jgi:hypothetical protein